MQLTGPDWVIVGLSTAIIFGLLGPRLLRDIRGWFTPAPPVEPSRSEPPVAE